MGFKCTCVFVNNVPGCLSRLPKHKPDLAISLLKSLSLPLNLPVQSCNFFDCVDPDSGAFSVGAYDQALAIAHDEIFGSVRNFSKPLVASILQCFSTASEILIAEAESSMNYFGYAYFQNGNLVRALSGSDSEGIVVDEGEIQEEENPYFQQSQIQNGQRIFVTKSPSGGTRERTMSQMGSTLLQSMTTKIFSEPLIEMHSYVLQAELFSARGLLNQSPHSVGTDSPMKGFEW